LHRPSPLIIRAVALGALVLGLPGCFTLRYLGRQGLDQLTLLRERRKVSDVIDDPQTPAFVRRRLELAMAARRFGIEVLGLRGGAEFTRYLDTHGPVAYNLTAAYRTRLKALEWRFPLVGRVPYLGFFTVKAAREESKRLQAEGYDTYLRPVGGFSSLGYILSPIYAAMIEEKGPRGDLRTVETMLHEMAHTTAWIGSASDLNESYATVVGNRGAVLFFKSRGEAVPGAEPKPETKDDAKPETKNDPEEEERRGRAFATWLRGVFQRLQGLYDQAAKERWPEAETLRRRDEAFREIQEDYRTRFPPPRYERLARGPINNAVLLSFGVYHLGTTGDVKPKKKETRRRLQEDLLASVDGDLRAYVGLYRRAQERVDGARWLRQLAEDYRKGQE
jgi:predicted aminopeptidase